MIDQVIVLGYFVITLFVGIWSGRKTRTMRDFSIANRSFPAAILVATIAATQLGAGSSMGFVEKIYTHGIFYLLIIMGVPWRLFFIGKFIAPRMERFLDMISVGDIMGRLYGRRAKIITGISGALIGVGYIASQVLAMGKMLNFFMGVPEVYGVLFGGGIVIFYSVLGGVRSVTMTDIVQFAVLILVVPIIFNVSLHDVGGFSILLQKIPKDRLSLSGSGISTFLLITLLVRFFIPWVDPSGVQRFLMAKDVQSIRKGFYLSSAVSFFFFFVVAVIGFIVLVLYPSVEDPHLCLPILINQVMPVGIRGLAIAGIFAIIMSSADSDLNAGTICFVHDFLKPLSRRWSSKYELFVARVATALLGGGGILVALQFKSIFSLAIHSMTPWLTMVGIPLLAGLLGFRTKERNFVIASLVGVLGFFVWHLFVFPIYALPAFIIGAALNTIALFGLHFLSKSRKVKA